MTEPKPKSFYLIRKWRKVSKPEKLVVVPVSDGEHYTLPLDIAHQLHLDYLKI